MKVPNHGTLAFDPTALLDVRFLATAVRHSSADPAVNPYEETAVDTPFAVEESLVLAAAPNPALVVAPSTYCARLLTPTGRITTTDTCPW
jgi:hypothetical protein